jgi:hypothetical protein
VAKGNKNAHAVQRATGWSYAHALRFVKNQERSREAGAYMRDQNISKREAFVEIAKAHAELAPKRPRSLE